MNQVAANSNEESTGGAECDIISLIFGGNGLKIKTTKLYDKI